MARKEEVYVALLRGINVGGKNKVPMAELRSALAGGECSDVRTYIQSGNLVLGSRLAADALAAHLAQAIEQHFGIAVPVVVKTASEWARYHEGIPFPMEAVEDGSRVLLVLSERAPAATAAAELAESATLGERIEQQGDAIWIHYAGGVGRSKLTPALLDRRIGSPATARNWKTVEQLQRMAEEAGAH